MYLESFALKRHPFRITPDPTLFCPGAGRGEILDALIYAVTSGEGIVKVVGEVGSGKTMLCRILEERLPESVEIVYLANPRLSPHDILYAIAFELKLPVQSTTDRLVVLQQLQAYLLSQHAAGRSVVVFIEEAQGMPLETLEEIRLLSNLETHRHKLLQIVLFGQPELEKNLGKRDIRQLKERITHSFYLAPLTRAETSEYLRFRLQAAGCGKSGVFSAGAERLIAQVSCGLIRRINILADKAMLAAYAEPEGGGTSGSSRAMVRSRHVRAAIRDSEFRLPFYRSSWFAGSVTTSLLVALVIFFGGQRLSSFVENPTFRADHFPASPAVETGIAVEADLTGTDVYSGVKSEEAEPDTEKSIEVKEQNLEQPMSGAETRGTTTSLPAAPGVSVSSLPETAAIASLPALGSEDVTAPEPLEQPAVVEAGANLWKQRLEAGRQWLQLVEPQRYTIQLMSVGMDGEVEVRRFLRQVRTVSLLEQIYICRASDGDRQRWLIVYGDFAGVTPARQAIDGLPPELRRFQPFVRRLDQTLRAGNAASL